MPNIASVTNPVPGQEGNTYRSPITPNDTQIQNIPDPTRVGRADARSDRQDTANMDVGRRYDSYFQTFLQALRSSGSITETAARFLIAHSGTLVLSGLSQGIAQELSQFMQMLSVGPDELLALLQNQMTSGARFSGKLFDALRDVLQRNPSAGLQNDILQFLKRFNDFSSTSHIERNLERTIRQMTWFMPSRFSSTLEGHAAQLRQLLAQGDRGGVLQLMQGTILPFLSDYVSQMHDRGIARSLLSLLILDIARYENGNPQSMLQSFYQLLGYSSMKEHFGQMDSTQLIRLLQESAASINNTNNPIADHLSQMSAAALRSDVSAELRQTFQALIDSILVNQSVYMPLAHAMLPVEMNGRMMFSELWVDPNAENETDSFSQEKSMRMLLKFDIQELGMFDLVLTYHDGTVDASLHCPPHLEKFTELFERKMAAMAEQDGLKAAAMHASPMRQSLAISEVFPKIFERKDSINVAI